MGGAYDLCSTGSTDARVLQVVLGRPLASALLLFHSADAIAYHCVSRLAYLLSSTSLGRKEMESRLLSEPNADMVSLADNLDTTRRYTFLGAGVRITTNSDNR